MHGIARRVGYEVRLAEPSTAPNNGYASQPACQLQTDPQRFRDFSRNLVCPPLEGLSTVASTRRRAESHDDCENVPWWPSIRRTQETAPLTRRLIETMKKVLSLKHVRLVDPSNSSRRRSRTPSFRLALCTAVNAHPAALLQRAANRTADPICEPRDYSHYSFLLHLNSNRLSSALDKTTSIDSRYLRWVDCWIPISGGRVSRSLCTGIQRRGHHGCRMQAAARGRAWRVFAIGPRPSNLAGLLLLSRASRQHCERSCSAQTTRSGTHWIPSRDGGFWDHGNH
jgi:hypothetical protein